MVAQKAIGTDLIAMLTAQLRDGFEAIPNFNSFYRVNTHHGMSNVRIKAVKYGLAPAGRDVISNDSDACTDRVSLLDEVLHIAL